MKTRTGPNRRLLQPAIIVGCACAVSAQTKQAATEQDLKRIRGWISGKKQKIEALDRTIESMEHRLADGGADTNSTQAVRSDVYLQDRELAKREASLAEIRASIAERQGQAQTTREALRPLQEEAKRLQTEIDKKESVIGDLKKKTSAGPELTPAIREKEERIPKLDEELASLERERKALEEKYAAVKKDGNAFAALKEKAEDGRDAALRSKMAEHYEKGIGTKQDIKKAIEWYLKAALQGHQEAMAAYKRLRKESPLPNVVPKQLTAEQKKRLNHRIWGRGAEVTLKALVAGADPNTLLPHGILQRTIFAPALVKSKDDWETSYILLSYGANPNLQFRLGSDRVGTPLTECVKDADRAWDLDVLALLVHFGGDLHSPMTEERVIGGELTDVKTTALHVAAKSPYPEFIRHAIAQNANVDQRNSVGETPLHAVLYAALRRGDSVDLFAESAEALVSAGAKTDIKDRKGITAARIAAALAQKSTKWRAALEDFMPAVAAAAQKKVNATFAASRPKHRTGQNTCHFSAKSIGGKEYGGNAGLDINGFFLGMPEGDAYNLIARSLPSIYATEQLLDGDPITLLTKAAGKLRGTDSRGTPTVADRSPFRTKDGKVVRIHLLDDEIGVLFRSAKAHPQSFVVEFCKAYGIDLKHLWYRERDGVKCWDVSFGKTAFSPDGYRILFWDYEGKKKELLLENAISNKNPYRTNHFQRSVMSYFKISIFTWNKGKTKVVKPRH